MEKVLVILNPTSGRGSGSRSIEAIRAAMAEAGVEFDLELTTRPGEAIIMAANAQARGYPIVAAAGGDGTINEVINGMAQATPTGAPVATLAILPVGTGNDFSDMVGAPRKLITAAQAIRRGNTRQVDLGHAQIETAQGSISRYFDNNVGLGLEAQVTLESRKITWLRGFAVYLLAVFKSLRAFQYPHTQIEWIDAQGHPQRVDQPSLMVSIGNSRRTGGGFYITPDAELDDGLLDVGIVQSLSVPKVLMLLPQVMIGAHRNHPAIRLVRCRSLVLQCAPSTPLHTDGEVLSSQAHALSVTLEPRRLHVIV